MLATDLDFRYLILDFSPTTDHRLGDAAGFVGRSKVALVH